MAKSPKTVKREAVEEETQQGVLERRIIRSRYLFIKNNISDKKDAIMGAESDKFNAIMNEVETLHQHVQRPREQVADAVALLDLANTLVTFSKSHANGEVTPSDFVTALLRNFGPQDGRGDVYNVRNAVSWADIGFAVSPLFRTAGGCSTMTGPMKTEMKQRASIVRRRMTRPTKSTRPEEVATNEGESSGTDKNMLTMFDILRKKRSVRLESLVLNRKSFAQTIENIFALSFLVKDGRAEITTTDSGHHLVSPRNAPSASAISSGKVRYHHYVFRFDFKDWKLMAETVGVGEELMPHRRSSSGNTTATGDSQPPTTPVRKLCRNRGLIVQEHTIGSCTTQKEEVACGDDTASPLPRKRRLSFD